MSNENLSMSKEPHLGSFYRNHLETSTSAHWLVLTFDL